MNKKNEYITVELPSKGLCYKNKMSSVKVLPLNAKDENIIMSDKLRANRTMAERLLGAKLVDCEIKPKDFCVADKDAVFIALAREAFGDEYTYKDADGVVQRYDLSSVEYKNLEFPNYRGGTFLYVTGQGNKIEYKILSLEDERAIAETLAKGQKELPKTIDDVINALRTPILKKQTVSVNKDKKKRKIESFLRNMGEEEKERYTRFLIMSTPSMITDVETDEMLLRLVCDTNDKEVAV